MKKLQLTTILTVAVACFVSFFLTVYRHDAVPVCMNADEAAFGYNAYSILKTGRDEYGELLPLRLKSFGDYKLPLYSYLSVPFIGIFGLTEQGARAANAAVALIFPLAVYLLARELFSNRRSAFAAAFIAATSLGLHIVARQAHEAYVSALLITLLAYCYLRLQKHPSIRSLIPFLAFTFISLFGYQSSRIFVLFFLGALSAVTIFRRKHIRLFIIAIAVTAVFMIPDFIHTPTRVSNLLFFKSPGLGMKTHELRTEGGSILLYNKVTVAARDFISNHLQYYSPEFLATRGDSENYRFGFTDMSPLTFVEYMLALAGVYYLFRTKSRHRVLLSGLLLIAPVAGSLSWAGTSLSRTLFFIVLASIMAGYGFDRLAGEKSSKVKRFVIPILFIAQAFFLVYGWDIYLNHYTKRPIVVRAVQCGYRELEQYINKTYATTNMYYISTGHGQPYIFRLFYNKIDPASYQQKASLSAPDKYGFGQVLGFDKFHYEFPAVPPVNAVIVGTPDEFKSNKAYDKYKDKYEKITVGTEEIFWIVNTTEQT